MSKPRELSQPSGVVEAWDLVAHAALLPQDARRWPGAICTRGTFPALTFYEARQMAARVWGVEPGAVRRAEK